jgi:hypothetical protein
MSLKLFLISTIVFSAVEAQLNTTGQTNQTGLLEKLGDFVNTTALLKKFGKFNTTALVEKFGTFFDFENAGTTKLGQLMAWKGDKIQQIGRPVLMFALGAVFIWSTVELLLLLITGILDVKALVIGNIFTLFQDVFQLIWDKILLLKNPILSKLNAQALPANDDQTPAADMGRRALDQVSEFVLAAVEKYSTQDDQHQ